MIGGILVHKVVEPIAEQEMGMPSPSDLDLIALVVVNGFQCVQPGICIPSVLFIQGPFVILTVPCHVDPPSITTGRQVQSSLL